MVWILIYWITTGSPGSYGGLHNSTASVEFKDEAACRAAYTAMRGAKNEQQGMWGVCVRKETESK